jgi:hypothetical protein
MTQSKFVLCPQGDNPWSFRFYEVLMCKSIPIVESHHDTYRTIEESALPYNYVLSNEVNLNANYDKITSNNTSIFEKWHLLKLENPINIFTNVYENCIWGNNENPEYKGSSGSGSLVENNKEYIELVKSFIKDKAISSVVDLGCGDWKCGKLLYDELPISYHGYDAYNKVIEYNTKAYSSSKYSFTHLDFLNNTENIQSADLCILKDVLMHFPLECIYSFLDNICSSKKFKYILITNCAWQKVDNTNIEMGQHRPLSKDFLPLKKYNPTHLLSYYAKEVLLITPI